MDTLPPLGLMPKDIWEELNTKAYEDARRQRSVDIVSALARYLDAGMAPRREWIKELEDRVCGPMPGGQPSGS